MLQLINQGLSVNTQMMLGTVITLCYLIVIELISAKQQDEENLEKVEGFVPIFLVEEKDSEQNREEVKKIFYPVIFAFVTLFAFILITNIMMVLK